MSEIGRMIATGYGSHDAFPRVITKIIAFAVLIFIKRYPFLIIVLICVRVLIELF